MYTFIEMSNYKPVRILLLGELQRQSPALMNLLLYHSAVASGCIAMPK
jgi:hypothetical protein